MDEAVRAREEKPRLRPPTQACQWWLCWYGIQMVPSMGLTARGAYAACVEHRMRLAVEIRPGGTRGERRRV